MSLVTLPLGTPHEDIFNVIRRDGGVIISNFMSPEQLEVLNSGAQPIFDRLKVTPDLASLPELGLDFYAGNTTHIRGLLGKMPQETSLIIQHDLWDAIMHETLKTTSSTWIGDKLFTIESSYVLSVASAYRVAPGAPPQVLHRDQSVHCVQAQEGSLRTSQTGCLVAGTRSTALNGATRVIPGSHLWGAERIPTQDQAVSAVMEPGSALFWLGSLYHGAGENISKSGDPDDVRVLYGVFGCQDFLRPEEAIHLTTKPSVARTLSETVLRRSGWAKGKGGAGNYDTKQPIDVLDKLLWD